MQTIMTNTTPPAAQSQLYDIHASDACPKQSAAGTTGRKRKMKNGTLLKIGAVAKLFDINTSVLRFWEDEFDELTPSRSPTGQRLYSANDLAVIKKLKKLLHTDGLTIEGAKKILSKSSHNTSSVHIKSAKVRAVRLDDDKQKNNDTQSQYSEKTQIQSKNILSLLHVIERELLNIQKQLTPHPDTL